MIRSLSRNGLVYRSITPCKRQTYLRLDGARPWNAPAYRLASTAPDNKLSSKLSNELPPIVPPKHRVELRPGPVKPTTSARPSPSEQTQRLSSSAHSKKGNAETAKVEAHSLVENTKRDYEEATKHGVIAPPPADAGRVGKLWHQAKEFFRFYVRGIKLINTHRKRVREIEARVKAGGEPISRWEARFIETYRIDAKKLIPFLLILVVLEEIIPLVVLYAPFMLPSTCVLSTQQERILKKRRDQIETYSKSMKLDFKQILRRAEQATAPAKSLGQVINGNELLAMCGVLSLSTFGSPLRLGRINTALKRISSDDALLIKEDMGQRLTSTELQEALDERGFVTNGLDRDSMQKRLRWWLTRVQEKDVNSVEGKALLVATVHSGEQKLR